MNSSQTRGSIGRHLTSAHIIALVALFVALGGISWAAATAPKNSVAAKSIKKNAVTNAKIKNNAVTGRKIKSSSILSSDVKNNALTGADINEGMLGTVPSADTAKTANTANDQFNRVVTAQSSVSNSDPNVARTQATEVLLVSHGTLTVYAKCFTDSDTNEIYFETLVETSANGAALYGYIISNTAYGNPALNVDTIETDRRIQRDAGPNDAVDQDYGHGASVIGADGKGLYFDVQAYGRAGNPIDPPAAMPAGNSCMWHINGSKAG